MAIIKRASIKGGAAASLRMSLPGYDVDTATLDQMAFDARFANMERYTEGFSVAPFTGVDGPTSTPFISFGRTFSTVPIVLALWGGDNPFSNPAARYSLNSFDIIWNTSSNTPQSYFFLTVTQSGMQFTAFSGFGTYFFQYIVFKPEI